MNLYDWGNWDCEMAKFTLFIFLIIKLVGLVGNSTSYSCYFSKILHVLLLNWFARLRESTLWNYFRHFDKLLFTFFFIIKLIRGITGIEKLFLFTIILILRKIDSYVELQETDVCETARVIFTISTKFCLSVLRKIMKEQILFWWNFVCYYYYFFLIN